MSGTLESIFGYLKKTLNFGKIMGNEPDTINILNTLNKPDVFTT